MLDMSPLERDGSAAWSALEGKRCLNQIFCKVAGQRAGPSAGVVEGLDFHRCHVCKVAEGVTRRAAEAVVATWRPRGHHNHCEQREQRNDRRRRPHSGNAGVREPRIIAHRETGRGVWIDRRIPPRQFAVLGAR